MKTTHWLALAALALLPLAGRAEDDADDTGERNNQMTVALFGGANLKGIDRPACYYYYCYYGSTSMVSPGTGYGLEFRYSRYFSKQKLEWYIGENVMAHPSKDFGDVYTSVLGSGLHFHGYSASRKISPYGGLGIGIGLISDKNNYSGSDHTFSPVLQAELGVDFRTTDVLTLRLSARHERFFTNKYQTSYYDYNGNRIQSNSSQPNETFLNLGFAFKF